MLLTTLVTVDEVLQAHAAALGRDLTAYRNHAYRVVNLSLAISSSQPDAVEKLSVAAAFHDLGIWTNRTFDYLAPSVRLATAHLARAGRGDWIPEITAMILEHHKITDSIADRGSLVEPFRRADWIDVTRGLRTFGLSRAIFAEVCAMWPSAGFHKRLVQLSLARLGTHPWAPLPMVKL